MPASVRVVSLSLSLSLSRQGDVQARAQLCDERFASRRRLAVRNRRKDAILSAGQSARFLEARRNFERRRDIQFAKTMDYG